MMSLSKMAPSGWRYYAEEVASGREDYFALSSDRPRRFLGQGAEALGTGLDVSGRASHRVEDEIIRRVRHRHPHVETPVEGERQPERFPRSLEKSESGCGRGPGSHPGPERGLLEAEVIRRGTSPGYIHHHEVPSHLGYEGPTLGR